MRRLTLSSEAHVRLEQQPARPECSPRLREARLEDYERIAALQLRQGLPARTRRNFEALWQGNPAYDGTLPVGWVLEDAARDVTGFIGNLPLAYHFNGRILRATTAYSWVVDPQYRGYSMLLLDRLVRQEAVDLIVCATANAAAGTAYRAFQFSRVPSGAWDSVGFWITGYRGFVTSALRASSVPAAAPLVYPPAAALFLRDAVWNRIRIKNSDCTLELCPDFDNRFDTFWDEQKREGAGHLLAVRDRESLLWHYRRSIEERQIWIVAAFRSGRMIAYATFERQDNSRIGLKRLRITDFQCLRGGGNALAALLDWMCDACRREGVHIAENIGCWLDRLCASGTAAPYRRRTKSWLFYYRAREQDLARQLQPSGAWSPTSFDGDASL